MSFAFVADDLAELTEDQKIAIMESLLVAVLADGKAPKSETDRFDEEVEAIPWGIERDQLVALMTQARSRIIGFKTQEEAIALIASIGHRLPEPELREKVFRAMGAIMYADQQLSRGEINVLGKYATAFAIPPHRLDAIKADLDAAFTTRN